MVTRLQLLTSCEQTDTSCTNPLPGLVRTVIADPPQPSAALWELVLKGGAETVRVVGVGLGDMSVLASR